MPPIGYAMGAPWIFRGNTTGYALVYPAAYAMGHLKVDSMDKCPHRIRHGGPVGYSEGYSIILHGLPHGICHGEASSIVYTTAVLER